MAILPRTEFGNPILRKKAKTVRRAYLATDSFKALIRDMRQTMRRADGVGLAAPQIGVPLRIAIIEMRPTDTRPGIGRKGPLVIINPRILSYGARVQMDWEGCLSFRGARGKVPRALTIVVEYMNEQGEVIEEAAGGLWARIFQHEIDHLEGTVYVDRMTDMKTLMTLSEYRVRILGKKQT